MNVDQIEIFKQYLSIETNYAIILTGAYGSGKTHFYKNSLVPEIKQISISRDALIKFKPIHISLFGIKSIEEIQFEIYLGLISTSKSAQGVGVTKSLVRGLVQIAGLGDLDKYLTDLNKEAINSLNYDEFVICFDDLDRKSESLSLADIFGFINSLVENQGAKILIIANEEKLTENKDYNKSLKEKVIGTFIQYHPDISNVFQQIIKERYEAAFNVYYVYLQASKDKIISTIEKNGDNFRNLVYFLEHFKTIFSEFEKLVFLPPNNERKEEKLEAVLKFSLAIGFELKSGNLTPSHYEDIRNHLRPFNFLDIELEKLLDPDNKINVEGNRSYISLFDVKYFSESSYYYLGSIFDYFIGIKAIKSEVLHSELSQYFVLDDGRIPRHEELLKKLDYLDCVNLPDSEYRLLTKEMLSIAFEGEYPLYTYATVFHFATRFENILGFNIPRLKKQIEKGIRKSSSIGTYIEYIDRKFRFSADTEYIQDITDIVNYCIKLNELKNTNPNKLNDSKELFRQFRTEPKIFLERIQSVDYSNVPFWEQFSISETAKLIKGLENEEIWRLAHYFRRRYMKNIPQELYDEQGFISSLIETINSPKSRHYKNLKNASLNYLCIELEKAKGNFKNLK